MKGARWAGLLLVMAAAAVAAAGDIQVFCEAGLRVYLDDELAGISSRLDDGLYLMDVGPGSHAVRVEKDGFAPQRFEVVVGRVPIEITVGEFESSPSEPESEPPAEAPSLPLGSLVITSAPQNCVVEIPGRKLVREIVILDGQRTLAEVSFMEGDEPFVVSHRPR